MHVAFINLLNEINWQNKNNILSQKYYIFYHSDVVEWILRYISNSKCPNKYFKTITQNNKYQNAYVKS